MRLPLSLASVLVVFSGAVAAQAPAAYLTPVQYAPNVAVPPGLVWSLGRARILAEPGDCGPTLSFKGYCFRNGARWLDEHPRKGSLDVITMDWRYPLGTFVPFAQGRGWDVYRFSRAGTGYRADAHRHFGTQIQVPPGCIYQGVVQQAWLIGIARGRKVAIEASQYACAGWRGPAFASATYKLEDEPFAIELMVPGGFAAPPDGPIRQGPDNDAYTPHDDLLSRFPPDDSGDIYGEPDAAARAKTSTKRGRR